MSQPSKLPSYTVRLPIEDADRLERLREAASLDGAKISENQFFIRLIRRGAADLERELGMTDAPKQARAA